MKTMMITMTTDSINQHLKLPIDIYIIRKCLSLPNIIKPPVHDNSTEFLKNRRICRSDPIITKSILNRSYNKLYPSRRNIKRRSSCGRRAKADGPVNVLRRRALSRHFSNSFASSLDLSSGASTSSRHTHSPITRPKDLMIALPTDRSTSSGYASRRSSLSGSPLFGTTNELQPFIHTWSDTSNSGCMIIHPERSDDDSSFHSLYNINLNDESDTDTESSLVNQLYNIRFAGLKAQMEKRLKVLIDQMENQLDCENNKHPIQSNASGRFIYCQIAELARDCLRRCENNQECMLTCDYFNNLSDTLKHTIIDNDDKISNDIDSRLLITSALNEFMIAIARTADVLECLQSNPGEFYFALNAIESQLNSVVPNQQSTQQYLLSQLKTSITSTIDRSGFHQTFNTIKHSQSQANLNRPVKLQDFNICKKISVGAYGSVYLVQHRESSKFMALKKLSKQSICRKNFIQQVFTERDILTFVKNPFVVSLHCSFETDHDLCLVMEYVEGGDVRSLLDYLQGPLTLDLATLYFAETTLAIEYIHSHGIIHRDIKPSNLLITHCGHIKLTDFGLSKIGLMDLTSRFYDKQVIGTPQYIAPEIILHSGYGQLVDWWSMGIVLYEMLVGCTPFLSDDVEDLFDQIVNAPIEYPDYLEGTNAQRLIKDLLSRDPKNRPAYIKDYSFFADIDWDQLLLRKADFVPSLSGPDDTSYFRSAALQEDNSLKISEDDLTSNRYLSFSSCSPTFLSEVSPSSTSSENSIKPIKNKRIRGSLLRARSFFFKRMDKKNDDQVFSINRDQTMGYGFTFATYISNTGIDKGTYLHKILCIIPGGPASKVGLLKGHRIIQINERDTHCLNHSSIVKIIQRSKHILRIVVSNGAC